MLRVSRDCPRTIYEFQHYIWAERKRNKEEYSPMEKAKKVNDHFMDCLRYIYNYDPRYINPTEDDETEVEFVGEYTKYPKATTHGKTNYRDLIEPRVAQF